MMLLEILDSQSDYEVVQNTSSIYGTQMTIKKGREVYFRAERNKGVWEVMFTEGGLKLTGRGNEFQIFAFVKSSLENFIKLKKPKKIIFTSDKDDKNRTKLYKKMVLKYMPKGWELEIRDNAERDVSPYEMNSDLFVLTKKVKS